MKMVGHKTESIYRWYAIVDETMLREAARSSHERSGAKFRAKSTAFGNRYARKNLKKLAGRDPRTPGFSSECAMTCKRLKWWAGTGLNRRHQDFQSHPVVSISDLIRPQAL